MRPPSTSVVGWIIYNPLCSVAELNNGEIP
ncbi:hypothetical protein VPHD239_0187 [Vibrio phage D239]